MTTRVELIDRYVTANGFRVRYWEAGAGRPLLCVHGLGIQNSADNWHGNAEAFGRIAHVYALDLPGWGMSDIPSGGYSFEKWVGTIQAFCDALHLDQVDIAGTSLGGWITALFAHQHPQHVRRVVLLNNAGLNPNPPGGATNFSMPSLEQLRRTNPEPMATEIHRRLSQPGREAAYRALLQCVTDPSVRERFSLRSRLPEMRMPILFVQADDNRTVGVQYAFEGFQLAPLGRLVVTLGPSGGGTSGYSNTDSERSIVAFLTAQSIVPAR